MVFEVRESTGSQGDSSDHGVSVSSWGLPFQDESMGECPAYQHPRGVMANAGIFHLDGTGMKDLLDSRCRKP